MSQNGPEVANRAVDFIKNHADTVILSAGMLVANMVGTEEMTVYVNSPLPKQAELSLPSALVAAEFGTKAENVAWQIGYSALGLEAIKRTTSLKAIGTIAVASELFSSVVSVAVEHSGLLTAAEQAQPNDGFSAVFAAWASKFILDKAVSATNNKAKRLWQSTMGLFSLGMTAGVGLLEGSNGGKMDAVTHASGIAVGAIAYTFGNWRQRHKQMQAELIEAS